VWITGLRFAANWLPRSLRVPPLHRRQDEAAQLALGMVVRGLHVCVVDEAPQCIAECRFVCIQGLAAEI
jgi:hypothetical protein